MWNSSHSPLTPQEGSRNDYSKRSQLSAQAWHQVKRSFRPRSILHKTTGHVESLAVNTQIELTLTCFVSSSFTHWAIYRRSHYIVFSIEWRMWLQLTSRHRQTLEERCLPHTTLLQESSDHDSFEAVLIRSKGRTLFHHGRGDELFSEEECLAAL